MTVLGGMLAATVIAIFIIPVTFYVSERFATGARRTPPMPRRAAGADRRRKRRMDHDVRVLGKRGSSPPSSRPRCSAAARSARTTSGPRWPSPPTFRGQATAEAASFADAPWWEAFQDPTLKALIQEALRNNYDAAIAAARVQEARANLRRRAIGVLPVARLWRHRRGGRSSRSAASAFPAAPTTGRTTSFRRHGHVVGARIWGRVRRSNEAARATLLATEDARRGVWLTLVSDLAQAYFELLALDVQLQIARNSTQAFQRTYDLFLDRFELGVASKLETSRAQGALGDAQATIPQLESGIVAKENQISILLGKAPGPIPRGKPMYAQPRGADGAGRAAVGAARAAARSPPGRAAAGGRQRPHRRGEGGVLSQAQPDRAVRRGQPRAVRPDGGGATVWAVAGMLSGPLFNAGRTTGHYRASIAQWEQARLQYEQAVLVALREVSDALTALGKLSDAETGQDTAVKALEEAVEHATDRYRQGLASYYEVLEAQQQLYPAQNTLAQIRRNRLVAYVQLYKALGGGWNLSDAQWTGATVPTRTP